MKHLKKFNESLEPVEVEELKDFCEMSLAYLLDDGYKISVTLSYDKQHIVVSLGLGEPKYSEKFDWNDVKDYYIPFLQMLVRRYELLSYLAGFGGINQPICFNTEMGFSYLSLDQVINDRVGLEIGCRLWGINLKIVDKI